MHYATIKNLILKNLIIIQINHNKFYLNKLTFQMSFNYNYLLILTHIYTYVILIYNPVYVHITFLILYFKFCILNIQFRWKMSIFQKKGGSPKKMWSNKKSE